MTPPEPPRWARWRTALAVVALICVGAIGFGATFVASGSDATSASAPVATASSDPSASATSSATPAATSDGATLEAKPSKAPPKPRPETKPAKEHKKNSLRTDVQDLVTETPVVPPTTFRVSSLNVLGASHTARHGNKPGYASGAQRMSGAVGMLRAFNVDVVGFQEFEPSQHAAFRRITGGRFGVYPGGQLGRNATRNSIAWRLDTWRLVSAHSIAIPYFHGHRVPMPYLLLEHIATGRRVWFMNIHNPASTKLHGNNQRWRNVATALEINLLNRLHSQTQLPVVFTGDFNERSEAFCRITSRTPSHAANGGSSSGRCYLPRNAGIDWIFGTDDVAFSNYGYRRSHVTDHPIVVSSATIDN